MDTPIPFDDTQVQVQIFASNEIGLGRVGIVINNCPITEFPDGSLKPCMKLSARQAMEIGMNLIHIAKIAETTAQAMDPQGGQPSDYAQG